MTLEKIIQHLKTKTEVPTNTDLTILLEHAHVFYWAIFLLLVYMLIKNSNHIAYGMIKVFQN